LVPGTDARRDDLLEQIRTLPIEDRDYIEAALLREAYESGGRTESAEELEEIKLRAVEAVAQTELEEAAAIQRCGCRRIASPYGGWIRAPIALHHERGASTARRDAHPADPRTDFGTSRSRSVVWIAVAVIAIAAMDVLASVGTEICARVRSRLSRA